MKIIVAIITLFFTATGSLFAQQKVDTVLHNVVAGETLYSLSKCYNLPIEQIIMINAEVLTGGLKTGVILKIPSGVIKHPKIADPHHTDTTAPKTNSISKINANKGEKNNPVTPVPAAVTNTNIHSYSGQIPTIGTDRSGVVNVALMMPFIVSDRENKSFVEFYYGVLIALDSLKQHGVSVNLTVLNTGRSESEVRSIISSKVLDTMNLIIGPVYEEVFSLVAYHAFLQHIPIISPLAYVKSDNPYIFQIAPSHQTKIAKLKEIVGRDKNIFVIRPDGNVDQEFEREISGVLPSNVDVVNYSKSTAIRELEERLSTDQENIIVILSSNENKVEEILARLSSIHNSLEARGLSIPDITVLGNSKWSKFSHIEKNLYFKLGVTYLTNYHADRSNPLVLNFDRAYIGTFGSLPTLYSYRGYDIATLFIGQYANGGKHLFRDITRGENTVLQVPYHFTQNGGGKFENNRWVAVKYTPSYEIIVY